MLYLENKTSFMSVASLGDCCLENTEITKLTQY